MVACSAEVPEQLRYQSSVLEENLNNTKFTLPGNIRRNNHTFFTVFLTYLVDDEHFALFPHINKLTMSLQKRIPLSKLKADKALRF